jgi:hypothetical protein
MCPADCSKTRAALTRLQIRPDPFGVLDQVAPTSRSSIALEYKLIDWRPPVRHRRNLGAFMASFRPPSNELFSRDFSDEKEMHSSSREHANTVGDRFRQRVRSSWFGGLLR